MRKILSLFSLLLVSCSRYYVQIDQKTIDGCYLASSWVGSPDARCPPCGKMLITEWHVPSSILCLDPQLFIEVLYRNYTKRVFCSPLDARTGSRCTLQSREEFEETGGILSYRAWIALEDGSCYRQWSHQLWVDLIQVDESS